MAEFEVKEQCKQCFHFQVCANIMKQQLLIREKMLKEENPKCEHFVSSADVDEVVRCSECQHWGGVTFGFVCRKFSGANIKICMHKDDFCSYGERRSE